MRKNQFSKRTGGAYTGRTPRNERYAHLSASGRRDGDDSGHSFHELATATRGRHRQPGAQPDTHTTPARNGKFPSSTYRKKGKARWYAIADAHKPTWGVYSDWNEVARLKPDHHKSFLTEHEARQWLDDVGSGRIKLHGTHQPYSPRDSARPRTRTGRKGERKTKAIGTQ